MFYKLYTVAKKTVFLWLVLSQIALAAPVPQLIKDINSTFLFDENPQNIIDVNGVVYYTADTAGYGKELWRYDPGSSTGSVFVADIYVNGELGTRPRDFTEVGGSLYFVANGKTANGEITGVELWKYDPSTSTAPVLLADLNAGRYSSSPGWLIEVGGILYFSADDGATGRELWEYDPIASTGPVLLKDINVGPGRSSPSNLTEIAGVLYFSAIGKTANGEETGRELWKYDPSSSTGPILVGDINDGSGSGLVLPSNLTEIAGVLYFSADDGATGRELWQYDPSASTGPVLVGDIHVGPGHSAPSNLIEVGGVLYFRANDGITGSELWQYDPRSFSSPTLVADIRVGSSGSFLSNLDVTDVGGVLYFSAFQGDTGEELWQYDPNASTGPVLIKDISFGTGNSNPTIVTEVGGVLYFTASGKTASGEITGRELWKYDPRSSSGAVLVEDISPLRYRGVKVAGVLYFRANGKTASGEATGRVLWKYDPTASKDPILVGIPKKHTLSSSPFGLVNINGIAYFSADDGDLGPKHLKRMLWKYDPYASTGPVLVADTSRYSRTNLDFMNDPDWITEVEGVLYFSANGDAETLPGYGYQARDNELWQYDPSTSTGPVLVADLDEGIDENSSPKFLTTIEGVLYFSADDTKSTHQLWQYDPRSSSGPVSVRNIYDGGYGSPVNLTEMGGVLYFSAFGRAASGVTTGRELWQYDPSSSTGPVLVADINSGTGNSNPKYLTEVGGVLYFIAIEKTSNDDETDYRLWKYDPSSSTGPVLVADINIGTDTRYTEHKNLQYLTEVEGILYLSASGKTANGEETGRELWKYDPSSSAAPVLLADLNAGPDSSSPEWLTEVEGVLYFSADDGITGRELWKYDPSNSTGPVLVVDMNVGTVGSSPSFLIEMGGTLYFSATDKIHGRELWGLINQVPAAVNDSYFLDANTSYTVVAPGVLSNDVNVYVDGTILSTILDTTVSHGSLVFNSNGSFSYTPEPGFSGVDSFSYHNSNGIEDSEVVTVSLTANSITTNHPTVANASADQLMIEAMGINTEVRLDGSGTTDADTGDTITYQWSWSINSIAQSASGISPMISLPLGNHLITLTAFDQNGATTSDTVNISIVDTTAPILGSVADITVNAISANGAVVVFTLPFVNDVADRNPVISCTANSGDTFAIGQTSVTCTVTDANGNSSSISFIVTVTGSVAVNNSYFLNGNTTYTLAAPGVLSNDINVEGDRINTILDTTVSHGSLLLNSNGSFSYTPTAGYSGLDSFSYYISGEFQSFEIATVSLTINSNGTNHSTVANAGADQLMIEATGINTDIRMDGTGTTDIDIGDTITYQWSWTTNSVAQSASGISPVISLPLGNHLITLTASDQNGSTSHDTVTISIVDTTAPALGTVTSATAVEILANGATMVFTLPDVNDAADPNPVVSCTSNPGDTFAIGQTPVICTATDANGNSRSTSFVVTVPDVISTFENQWVPIETGSDDAEQEVRGNVSLFSSDLELTQDGLISQLVGLRFHLQIPAGATILSANIQFTADETSTVPTDLLISAEATPHALTFNDLFFDISTRLLTVANVPWVPAVWTLKGEAGLNQQTPDLSVIVQEIVDQDDWMQGYAMAFIISGTGMREAESFDGTAAPVLNVTFYTAQGIPEAPVAVDDDTPTAAAYTTDVEQPLIVPNGAGDIVQRNDNIGFPAAEVTFFDESSAEGGLVSVNPDGSFSYTPAAGFEGVDSFNYTLQNTEGSDSATVYIRVRDVTRLSIPVIIDSDDAEEDESNGKMSLASTDLELTRDDDDPVLAQQVGVRFQGLNVPPGSTIIEAYIQYVADEKDLESTNLTVYGEASADAMTFSTTRFDMSGRTLTTAQVPWAVETWLPNEQSSRTRTPDLSPIVQEIVDQDAWLEGNAIAFITTGSGQRVAKSFNGSIPPIAPAVLHVTYSTKPNTEDSYVIGDTGPGGGIVFYTTNSGLNGLEVAPERQGQANWGCYATTFPPAIITDSTGSLVGTGELNTADILAACNEAGIAAEIADLYQLNTVSDWFLPSANEALLMHEQRVLLGLNANFWTSTENSAYSAFYLRLSQGDVRTGNKEVLFDVWPIRAF